MAAEEVFDEPLESEVFDPWPLAPVLDFIESALKRRRAGFARLWQCGLIHAVCGSDGDLWTRRTQFAKVREFGNSLSAILDKVERARTRVGDPRILQTVLLNWSANAPKQISI